MKILRPNRSTYGPSSCTGVPCALFFFVARGGIEPPLQEWKSCVLPDRRTGHPDFVLRCFSITGAKVRIIFEYASVLQKKCRIISSRSTERGIKNASAFKVKRPCVWIQTSLRLLWNVLAFESKRTCVFLEMIFLVGKMWSVLKIVVSLKINSWQSWQVKHYIPKKVVSSAKLQQKLNIRIFSP